MNKQYKTTEEVAVALGLTDPERYDIGGGPAFNPETDLRGVSESVKRFLKTPEFKLREVFFGLQTSLQLVSAFNYLGNPRDYNYQQGVAKTPEEVSQSVAILTEEVKELSKAMEENNLAEIVDGVCDVIYVALGIALKYDLDYETLVSFPLVCHNNLLKLKEDAEGNFYADIVNGKIQKPEGFVGLDLSKMIPTLKGGENA